ncbi:MAG: hypothetical protein NT157_05505 [Candidatus Micrarchaeota archaeon]|nr:hypothetical protein [Candidatus Micrarchaeota archaeon]
MVETSLREAPDKAGPAVNPQKREEAKPAIERLAGKGLRGALFAGGPDAVSRALSNLARK